MNSRKNFIIIIFIMTIFYRFFISCKKEDNSQPGTNEIFMQGNKFNPSSITVSAGTTVKWTNKDNVTHTASGNNNAFESGDMTNGKTFSFTFSSVGTFNYICKYHSGMTGKVIVQ